MPVLFDNNVLCLLLHPDADVPNDPSTKEPISNAADRVRYLAEVLQEQGTIIIIPTPVLSEFLTFAGPEYLAILEQSIWFEIADFDTPAAIEGALALRHDLGPEGSGKKFGVEGASWQRVKVDRQIVAVGKARGVTTVYSTDKGVLTAAKKCGLKAVHVAELQLPPQEQHQITFDEMLAPTSEQPSIEPPPLALRSPDDEKA